MNTKVHEKLGHINNAKQKKIGNALIVFNTSAFLTYSWSIIVIFWHFPGLLLKYNFQEMIGYWSYQMVFSFFESVFVTLMTIVVSFLVPKKYMRDDLSITGSTFVIIVWFYLAIFPYLPRLFEMNKNIFDGFVSTYFIFKLWIVSPIAVIPIILIIVKKESISILMKNILDKISVLVGIYMIATLFSFVIVIFRNLL